MADTDLQTSHGNLWAMMFITTNIGGLEMEVHIWTGDSPMYDRHTFLRESKAQSQSVRMNRADSDTVFSFYVNYLWHHLNK